MAKETLLLILIVGIVAITAIATNLMHEQNIGGQATQTLSTTAETPHTTNSPTSTTLAATQQQTINPYNQQPIPFLKNMGQWDHIILYQASHHGTAVQFLPNAISFALGRKIEKNTTPNPLSSPQEKNNYEYLVYNLNFLNANPATITNSGETPSTINYLKGKDPTKWVTHTPQTQKITYNNLYPNIDLAFYTQDKALKYDLILKPGANPKNIQLQFKGIQTLTIDPNGNLQIHHPWGTVLDQAPIAYQTINGHRQNVPIQYTLLNENTYGFRITGSYDVTQTLTIDPLQLVWSTFMGATALTALTNNGGRDIAIDQNQNVYLTGLADSSYPTTPGVYQGANAGGLDVFVTKLKNDGTDVEYTTFIGGSTSDFGKSIALSPTGEAYITGYTYSKDFPTTPGAYQTAYAGGKTDVFVTKLNPTGAALIYSTYLGGYNSTPLGVVNATNEEAHSLAVNGAGEAYIIGYTGSSDFPTTPGAYQTNYKGKYDAFVTKLNPTGTALIYSTYLGGSAPEIWGASGANEDIAVNSAGEAYITGLTDSTDFPTTPGAYQTNYKSPGWSGNAFVTKLNALGTNLIYSTYIGGGGDVGQGIAINPAGEAYITGGAGVFFPTTAGAYQTIPSSGTNAFVTKLNALGTNLIYSTYLSGQDDTEGTAITLNRAGEAYITGYTYSSDFPTTADAYQTINKGESDFFITHLSADGKNLACGGSTYFGGSRIEDDYAESTLDPTGTFLYVTGTTNSDDFPIQDQCGVTGPPANVYRSVKPNPGNYEQPIAFKMRLNCDGSTFTCLTCGNGILDPGEECDTDSQTGTCIGCPSNCGCGSNCKLSCSGIGSRR